MKKLGSGYPVPYLISTDPGTSPKIVDPISTGTGTGSKILDPIPTGTKTNFIKMNQVSDPT